MESAESLVVSVFDYFAVIRSAQSPQILGKDIVADNVKWQSSWLDWYWTDETKHFKYTGERFHAMKYVRALYF